VTRPFRRRRGDVPRDRRSPAPPPTLALAQGKADRLGRGERVTLVRGTVEDVAANHEFDAAACLFVLHFLPDEAKLALMRAAAARLQPGAPLLVASGTRPQADDALRADFIGAWQQYGELAGMPAERMAGIIQEVLPRQAAGTAAHDYARLLHEAGFRHVGSVVSVLSDAISAWIAR
jgi:tRNA (cmo5U34)-methyltransferase